MGTLFVLTFVKPIRHWNNPLLILVVTIVAIAWVAVAYLIADTGYAGGISPRDEQLIYAVMAFILGFAGWAVVWRQDVFSKDFAQRIKGNWALVWGYLAVVLFWGAALWFTVQAFK